jgi:phytoene dehydrogenase-like protein
VYPRASVAHPLDGQPAVLLVRSLEETAAGLGDDARAWRALFGSFVRAGDDFLADLLGPLRIPRHPLLLARFGLPGLLPATTAFRGGFRGERARAVLAGCAAHSILPLDRPLTAAVGMIFALTAHLTDWPVAAGGSQAIAGALASYLQSLGGTIETGRLVRSLADLPPARVVVFDTTPAQLADVAGPVLPAPTSGGSAGSATGPPSSRSTGRSTARSRGATRVASTRRRSTSAARSTRSPPPRPRCGAVSIPSGRSCSSSSRASSIPRGRPPASTPGYAYCHVPADSTVDQTAAIERQIERFAPGFRDRILARHVIPPADLERDNPNYVGGAITGGVTDLAQFFTRPVARLDPYSTPNPRVFICSASTPPGPGVHGMGGWFAARSALRSLARLPAEPPPLR